MNERAKRIYNAISQSGLSYGELSKITGIPKSALQRYATGETTKVPIERVELIAKATNSSASSLMGWSDLETDIQNNSIPDYALDIMNDEEMQYLLKYYNELNTLGKKEAVERVKELTYLPKYKEQQPDHLRPVAAHNDNISEEELKLIMEDLKD